MKEDSLMATTTVDSEPTSTLLKFNRDMYEASLAYYGLPVDYNRVFKQILLTDRQTGKPILDKTSKQQTTLVSCSAEQGSRDGKSPIWVQINQPHEGTALNTKGYPKKAGNGDIGKLSNITLDFEYPQEPQKALVVGRDLISY